jgi:formylglycine-generating enzyme required for sulfatase activity
MSEATRLGLSSQFIRNFPVPIDRDFVFPISYAGGLLTRDQYITDPRTSGLAYSGMIIADTTDNKVYFLGTSGNPATMAWREVGVSINEIFGAANSGMLFKTGDNTFAVRGLSSGNNIFITNPSGLAGNPTISLSTSVTGLNNLTSTNLTMTSGVVTSRLAVSGLLTLNGRDITTDVEAIPDTNTANFNLSVGSVTNVGSNGGPSHYGTYDQGGNVREIMYSGSASSLAVRGGNFVSSVQADQLNKSVFVSQTPTAFGPGVGFRLSSRENIGKSYPLTFSGGASSTITTANSVVHGFQIGDPLKFANDNGLPAGLGSGITYYVVSTGLTTFSVSTVASGSAVSITGPGSGTTSTSSSYDYGSFVRVENSGNSADGSYGAVSYNYRIGKFEVTNDEYVEFLNATARDDHDAGSLYYDSSVDRALYEPMMETEAPNNGISRNATFPDYYYASLRGMNKKPVVFVSYIDAARYANWLHNGKPVSSRYQVCSIVNGLSNTATVTLANHGFQNGDEISFNCLSTSSFNTSTLTKNTKFIVADVAGNTFNVKTTVNGNVTFNGTGTFYVKRFFDKVTNIDNGAHNLTTVNESAAIAKSATARYWISTENEWYKAAYYDPSKLGAGVPGYWTYPTRSDTMPSGISADVDGNGSYNPGGTVPSHYHSSYDVSDFADRVNTLISNGDGTQTVYTPSITTGGSISINVTGIPLSKVVDVTASASEVNYLAGIVLGSGSPSKVLSLNANSAVSGISRISANIGAFISGSFGASTSTDFASTLTVGGIGVSLSGHKHLWPDITNFCSGVASCVDTSLVATTGLQIAYNSGTNTLSMGLSGQALALHNFASSGILVRTGPSAFSAITINGSTNINVSGGNGVSGNPTISLTDNVSVGSLSTTGNLTIGNNLIVNGSTITANVDTMTVEDPVIVLGQTSGTIANTSYDRGLELRIAVGQTGFMGYDVNASEFVLLSNTTNVSETFTGTYGRLNLGSIIASGLIKGRTLESTVASGTAPIVVLSPTLVTDLNSDLLDGQHGSYYRNWASITGIASPTYSVSLTGDVSGTVTSSATTLGNNVSLSISTTIQPSSVALGTDTTGNYAGAVSVSGSGLSINSPAGAGGTYTISSNAVSSNTSGTLVFRDSFGNFNTNMIGINIASGINSISYSGNTVASYGSTSISGIAANNYLFNFIVDGGTP